MSEGKLVRDGVPALISAEGRTPVVEKLSGAALMDALYAKLTEEQAELLAATMDKDKCEEIADIIEVLIALAAQFGCNETELMEVLMRKRAARGGFVEGVFLHT
jgi:predicted house-cleaning noncanonical NTP pyrophosphatase (MazG superfamily)